MTAASRIVVTEPWAPQHKWDLRYLSLARYVAQWSKDPSTKTGAVIVRPDNSVASLGFNGLPRGVHDNETWLNVREIKYKVIVHCERNAIIYAKQDLTGCTLYTWPFESCATCASMVIQAGIKKIVAPDMPDGELKQRWKADFELSHSMFEQAGVTMMFYPEELIA